MKIRYKIFIAAMAFCSGAAWAALTTNVDQRGIAFSTSFVNIAKGSVVNFTNSDSTSHNIIVSGEGISLNSGLQAPGVAFKAPFLKAGVYRVSCGIHPKMKMTISVQ